MDKTEKKDNWWWLKAHVDTILVLSTIFSTFLWMNGKFNDLEKDMSSLKTDIAIMKTVMIMRDMMPKEMASSLDVKEAKKNL